MNTQVMRHIQLYKHPLIMIYASVDLSGIITSILSPSPPLPSRPERVPAPPASQPFNLVSPICMTGTKTYDLAGRTGMEGPGCVFSVSRVINFPLWSPLDYGSIILGRELLNIINTQHSSALSTTTPHPAPATSNPYQYQIFVKNKNGITKMEKNIKFNKKSSVKYVVPVAFLLLHSRPVSPSSTTGSINTSH